MVNLNRKFTEEAPRPGYETLVDRAITRARAQRRRVFKLNEAMFRVKSRTVAGLWHIVRVGRDGRIQCDCTAGQYWAVCVHAAAVYRRLQRDLPTAYELYLRCAEGGPELFSEEAQVEMSSATAVQAERKMRLEDLYE